jgi:hypothetical protein
LKVSPVITVEVPTRFHPGLLAEAFPSSLRKGEILWQIIVDDEACTDTTWVWLYRRAEGLFCWMRLLGRHRSMHPPQATPRSWRPEEPGMCCTTSPRGTKPTMVSKLNRWPHDFPVVAPGRHLLHWIIGDARGNQGSAPRSRKQGPSIPPGRFDVTPFVGPGLMRVGGCGHAAAPC